MVRNTLRYLFVEINALLFRLRWISRKGRARPAAQPPVAGGVPPWACPNTELLASPSSLTRPKKAMGVSCAGNAPRLGGSPPLLALKIVLREFGPTKALRLRSPQAFDRPRPFVRLVAPYEVNVGGNGPAS